MAAGLPEGTDAQALLDAFILDTEVASVEVVSQTDTEAVVKLVGTMSMDINVDALAPFIESMLAASGQEVTPDMVEMMTGMLSAEFTAESTDIDEEITLVPGDTMAWLICDELGAEDDGMDDDGTDDDDMDDDGMDDDGMTTMRTTPMGSRKRPKASHCGHRAATAVPGRPPRKGRASPCSGASSGLVRTEDARRGAGLADGPGGRDVPQRQRRIAVDVEAHDFVAGQRRASGQGLDSDRCAGTCSAAGDRRVRRPQARGCRAVIPGAS